MNFLFRLILLITCFIQTAYAQEKGLKVVTAKTDTGAIDFNRRIALVIGNEQYEKDPLKNPVNDASRFAEVLRKYGFHVIQKNNLSRKELNNLINDFGDSITARKGVSFFYYSGHGLQYNSENYIVPVKSSIEKESDIEDEAVKLEKVFDKMKRTGNGLNIVILDACRNNPWYTSLPNLPKGLTDKESLPGNTSVFFATTPGNTALDGKGANSPFTESLVEAITDSIEFYQVVRKVVKQVKRKTTPVQQPAITGSPEDEFFFTQRKTKPRLFFLSIGVSSYQDSNYNLRYARKDAQDVALLFKQQQGLLYESVHQYILADKDASKRNILETIRNIKSQVSPGDVLMLFFAGHNVLGGSTLKKEQFSIPIEDSTMRSFFMPADGDFEYPETTAIDLEDIRSFLADMPCRSVLFIDGSYKATTAKTLTATENGVVIFASTSPEHSTFAIESSEFMNGVFAHALIKAITGAADKDKTGYVDLHSLREYISKTVARLTNGLQTPTAFFPAGISNFQIATVE